MTFNKKIFSHCFVIAGVRKRERCSKDEGGRILFLEKKNSEVYEKLHETVPRKEYDKLLEELRDNEILVNNMRSKIDEQIKKNTNYWSNLKTYLNRIKTYDTDWKRNMTNLKMFG